MWDNWVKQRGFRSRCKAATDPSGAADHPARGTGAMAIEFSPTDREYLEHLLVRPAKPRRRQRAKALLLLGQGLDSPLIAQIVGIPNAEVDALKDQFATLGIAVLGRRAGKGIEKTAGVCGGSARIAGTRIPVWQLVEARNL